MLTWEDCLGCCDVEEDLIDAVAEHEHLPEMLALEMANYLVHTAEGGPRLKQIILDDIDAARARGGHKMRYRTGALQRLRDRARDSAGTHRAR